MQAQLKFKCDSLASRARGSAVFRELCTARSAVEARASQVGRSPPPPECTVSLARRLPRLAPTKPSANHCKARSDPPVREMNNSENPPLNTAAIARA